MSLRLAAMALVHLIAVVYFWHYLIETLGQSARYLPLGWWASLLALVMMGMGVMVPVGALFVSLLVGAVCVRLAPPAPGQPAMHTWLASLVFAGAYALGGLAMWTLAPPTPHVHSSYGGMFHFLAWSMALSLGVGSGMATTWWLRFVQPRQTND